MLIQHVPTVLVFWVLGAADARAPSFVQEPQAVPNSICFVAPSSKILGSAPPAPQPPVEKRDAQHKFLQHKGAHTEQSGRD